jgi:hypothetical protein
VNPARKRKLGNLESSPDSGLKKVQRSRDEESLEQQKKKVGLKKVTMCEIDKLCQTI